MSLIFIILVLYIKSFLSLKYLIMENIELVQKIKGIQLKAKFLANTVLSGDYHTAFKGQGIEFAEVREYVAGDDIRFIDQNVTARMNTPYIKEFIEERELTIMILVDLSASQNFGTINSTKKELAVELSALLSQLALINNDKVGLLVFTDKVEKYLPPKKGKSHVWKVIREVLTFEPQNKHTNISEPLKYLLKAIKKKSIVFLISDFLSEGFEKELKQVSSKHDLISLKITDPKEYEINDVGIISFEDSETGEILDFDTFNNYNKTIFKELNLLEQETLKKVFLSFKSDFIEIDTSKSYIKDLLKYFKLREKRY
jgi:uncharacterized protein (DUF58 family)